LINDIIASSKKPTLVSEYLKIGDIVEDVAMSQGMIFKMN